MRIERLARVDQTHERRSSSMQAIASIAPAKSVFATPKNELVALQGFENRTLCDHGTSFAASRLRYSDNQIINTALRPLLLLGTTERCCDDRLSLGSTSA